MAGALLAGALLAGCSGRLRCVSHSAPDLHMLNLVVADIAASLDFYRRLGIAVPAGGDATGAHVQLGGSAMTGTTLWAVL